MYDVGVVENRTPDSFLQAQRLFTGKKGGQAGEEPVP
jgi:hypothetical protein